MRIGYTNDSYPERRTILEGNLNELVRLKSFNRYYIGAVNKRIPYLKNTSKSVFFETVFKFQYVDGLHFFNSITKNNTPWVSTYETCIPRLSTMSFFKEEGSLEQQQKEKRYAEKYVKILANDNCRKIIALSKINQRMQEDFLNYFPDYKEKIMNKMVQLYPPQKKIVTREFVEKKQTNKVIHFLFVGKFFNLKGGNEIVDVFDKIYKETNYKFKLTLVSLGDMNNHAFGDFFDSPEYLQKSKQKIDACPSIEWIHYIENKELLEMMKHYDVGILPSWGDTFGYSILEMQATGIPVISSNIRAFEEINNEKTGWIIQLPLSKYKEIHFNSLKEKIQQRKNMQNKLEEIVLDILAHPEQLKEKRIAAYDQVTKQHSTEKYFEKLNQIYKESFL